MTRAESSQQQLLACPCNLVSSMGRKTPQCTGLEPSLSQWLYFVSHESGPGEQDMG